MAVLFIVLVIVAIGIGMGIACSATWRGETAATLCGAVTAFTVTMLALTVPREFWLMVFEFVMVALAAMAACLALNDHRKLQDIERQRVQP